jgi:hypothetical protein
VVILGDIPHNRFTAAQLQELVKAVGDGVGLVTLAGYDSYGAGYFGTPLATLFPFYLDAGTLQRDDSFPLRPAPGEEDHPIVQLGPPEENDALWARLPQVVGGVRPGRPKPAATVVLTDDAGQPTLMVQPYGKGRVASLLMDGTWRWALQDKETQDAHRRLWRQMLLWASGQENVRKNTMWIELPQSRYLTGEAVSPVIHLEDADGHPISDASLEVTVAPAKGGTKKALRLYRAGENWESLYVPAGDGDYVIEARAFEGNARSPREKPFAQATARFLVEKTNLELADPLAHIATLSQIATMTDGSLRRPDTLAQLFDKLVSEHRPVELTQVRRHDLWNRPELLVLVVALLAADWIIRKRSGLA